MAVGTPANLEASFSTTDASSYDTATYTPTANAKLLAFICVGHRTVTPTAPSSLTGHGVTWTKVTDVTTSNNTWNCSLWEAVAPASPGSDDLSIALAATAESCTWRVLESTGAQVAQSKTLATSSANPSLTLDSAVGGSSASMGFLLNNNNSTTISAGSGYTDIGTQQSSGTAPVFKQAVEYDMTATTTVAFTASGSVVRGLIGIELSPAATTVNFGQATETDSSAAASYSKTVTEGQATGTNESFAASLTKTVTEGLATGTNAAQANTYTKDVTLGQATETDAGLAVAGSKAATLGQASGTNSGLAATLTKTVTLGLATESDAGLTMSTSGGTTVSLGQATETDAGLAVVAAKTITLGQASTTETAAALTITKALTATQATEVDTALGVTTTKARALTLAAEADTLAAATLAKTFTLGQATETSLALGLVADIIVQPTPASRTHNVTAQVRLYLIAANRLLTITAAARTAELGQQTRTDTVPANYSRT